MTNEQVTATFGYPVLGLATMSKDVKTKMGLAFTRGESVTVFDSGIIETGPYAGQRSYTAWSVRNNCLTAIRPTHFKLS